MELWGINNTASFDINWTQILFFDYTNTSTIHAINVKDIQIESRTSKWLYRGEICHDRFDIDQLDNERAKVSSWNAIDNLYDDLSEIVTCLTRTCLNAERYNVETFLTLKLYF